MPEQFEGNDNTFDSTEEMKLTLSRMQIVVLRKCDLQFHFVFCASKGTDHAQRKDAALTFSLRLGAISLAHFE